ncbi:MAG: ABC transporter substrate-binding protein [Desulfobacterales bacterium]|nr:ABC transporter substrate-binding protein [Desulfobacterales bacterium]
MAAFAKANDKITIGVLCPLTGPYSFEAESQRNFAYLAADEINAAGGVLGRQIDIVVEDTELKAGTGAKKAEMLIQRGIRYLTGGVSSNVVATVSRIAHEHGVLHIGIGGSNALTGKDCNRHHFNLDTAAYQMVLGTGALAIDKIGLPKKWFTITANYSWGRTCLESTKKMLAKRGGRLVGNVMVPLREKEFSPALLKALVSDAPVLAVIVYGAGQGRLLQQAYDFGITNRKMKVVVIASDLTIALHTEPEALQGVYFGLPWYWDIDDETARKLNRKYVAKFGKPPAWPGVQVYDSIQVLAMAMKRAGSFDVPELIPVLENLEFQTSKGHERIRACDHRAVQDWYVGRGKDAGDMEGKWDIMEIIGKIGGEKIMYSCEETGCKMNSDQLPGQ